LRRDSSEDLILICLTKSLLLELLPNNKKIKLSSRSHRKIFLYKSSSSIIHFFIMHREIFTRSHRSR
jgi:hypothetical protein